MKKIVKAILSILLIFSVFVSVDISVEAAGETIYLMGIKDSDGSDRTSWMSSTTSLSNLGATIKKYKAFSKSNFSSYIDSGTMLVVQTHGAQTKLKCVDSSGNETYFTVSNASSLDLSNMRICFIGACNCGKGGTSADNLVNAIYDSGAAVVIGYTKSVTTNRNSLMLSKFCTYIGNGATVAASLRYGLAQVLANYGDYGNVDCRLVRGSTSLTYATAAATLLQSDDVFDASDVVVNLNSGIEYTNDISTSMLDLYETGEVFDIYIDSYNNEYYFTENKCIGFYTDELVNHTELESDQIASLAQDYLSDVISDSDYELGYSDFADDVGIYTFIYYTYLNGIKTEDYVYCLMDIYGNVVSAAYPNQNKFSNITLENVTSDNIEELCTQNISEILNLDTSDFELVDYMVRMNSDSLLYMDVTVSYMNEEGFPVQESFVLYLSELV